MASLSSLYRTVSKACLEPVGLWDETAAGHWDTAIRGSSALRAALARSLQLEVAALNGHHSNAVLWDLDGFYESINPDILLQKCLELDYPKWHLAMGLMIVCAPRYLAVNGFLGP